MDVNHRNVKFCWSVNEMAACLVGVVDEVLSRIADEDVRKGNRLKVNELLVEELVLG